MAMVKTAPPETGFGKYGNGKLGNRYPLRIVPFPFLPVA